jgi:hypothetical protein
VQVLVAMLEPYKGRVFETLQSANTSCRTRRMNRFFSLSASNEIPRSRERERMSAGQVRDVGEKQFNAEKVRVRCRNFGMNRRGEKNFRGQRWPCTSNTTWKLARVNLAVRGINANLGPRNADSFRAGLHPDLKADFILTNPPFNMSDWGGENLRQDVR